MVNALTRKTGFTLGPIILEVLVKHYFERISKDEDSHGTTKLRKEELLYDEAFNIIKSFMEASTKHTVEELQEFSNTRTPSPPWVHVVRLLVPMSCCDEAATHLVKALGGEEVTKRVVGGTKWWQVRGVKGVDAEWIVAKKDWQEAKKKQKARGMSMEGASLDSGNTHQELPPGYQPEMDEMRCILYAHGGSGYYFGSIDQERYSIQRLARKINGRVFAMNYRLAPQYPFPCAIQDMLAAYLYLIEPPPGSLHTPVSPSNIVFGGDSAGGGLCIATLQVIRDAGLPSPAGAVLISPWCDLTHSFPSIHLNTATDIIPQYGLSFHKPSTLWPPPPDEVTKTVHHTLRQRIREVVRPKTKDGKLDVPNWDKDGHPNGLPSRPTTPDYTVPVSSSTGTLHLGGAGSVPIPPMGTNGVRSQRVSMVTQSGEEISIDGQVHMYAPNYLLTHPLVSPVVSYLGGLPPLLVIASDKEVLRDEIIYFAHKAAHPDKYPVKPEARLLYPILDGIEQRYGPTKVHLQVYDGKLSPHVPSPTLCSCRDVDCAHTLPILFAFTTPSKFCFRGMATFIKYVTGLLPRPKPTLEIPVIPESAVTTSPTSTQTDLLDGSQIGGATSQDMKSSSIVASITPSQSEPSVATQSQGAPAKSKSESSSTPLVSGNWSQGDNSAANAAEGNKSLRRALTSRVNRASVYLRRNNTTTGVAASSSSVQTRQSTASSDVGGPRFQHQKPTSTGQPEHRYAGEHTVYDAGLVSDTMIRERVSTQGVIRALEPESELDAFRLPRELIGEISELAVRRYIDGTEKYGKKFGKTAKAIEKARQKTLERASQDTMRNMAQLHTFLSREREEEEAVHPGKATKGSEGRSAKAFEADTAQGVKEGLAASGSWPWAWALDTDENPPSSSIVSRRDTEEARRLAKIADQAVFMDANALSGNNLWSLIVNFLTATPDRHAHENGTEKTEGDGPSSEVRAHAATEETDGSSRNAEGPPGEKEEKVKEQEKPKSETMSRKEKIASRFAWLVSESRKSKGASKTQTEQ
ncbi:hypothetical protein C8Q80DRAFT_1097008 [Daedaleopsis nitida]|nr:hypothetical protein C8Q80DRAFT_1097008 [Daedaleopsis nitida]